eukprot:CAMPEP_0180295142 /NCGR_PEP_ID=MMETSP0988-20121125/18768_1 /TAXON_ID=697907 /ORGANISM="non described non described, Strain CCMP2293" /LENGTH=79 /DNA_ID=CAMNT_0022272555 /DNA_START=315 /DNA_END=550 /DNA_ORIENTATION=+
MSIFWVRARRIERLATFFACQIAGSAPAMGTGGPGVWHPPMQSEIGRDVSLPASISRPSASATAAKSGRKAAPRDMSMA